MQCYQLFTGVLVQSRLEDALTHSLTHSLTAAQFMLPDKVITVTAGMQNNE